MKVTTTDQDQVEKIITAGYDLDNSSSSSSSALNESLNDIQTIFQSHSVRSFETPNISEDQHKELEKLNEKLSAVEDLLNCKISSLSGTVNSFSEVIHAILGKYEEQKSKEILLQENIEFLRTELTLKNNIIKSLLETQKLMLSKSNETNKEIYREQNPINHQNQQKKSITQHQQQQLQPRHQQQDHQQQKQSIDYQNQHKKSIPQHQQQQLPLRNQQQPQHQKQDHQQQKQEQHFQYLQQQKQQQQQQQQMQQQQLGQHLQQLKQQQQRHQQQQQQERTLITFLPSHHPEQEYIHQHQQQEKQFSTPIVPGHTTYSESLKFGKKTFVFGTSLIKGIRQKEFNSHLHKCSARFRPFTGATLKKMEIHIQPDLIDDKPDVVVIHAGCNDIPNTSLEPRTIAEGIIKLGKICKNYNTNDIFISSLTCRSRNYLNTRVKSVNGILKDLCKVYNFHYIDNSNISREDLGDGLHLEEQGKIKLANNFINNLNSL